jgi:hypothetical protein
LQQFLFNMLAGSIRSGRAPNDHLKPHRKVT